MRTPRPIADITSVAGSGTGAGIGLTVSAVKVKVSWYTPAAKAPVHVIMRADAGGNENVRRVDSVVRAEKQVRAAERRLVGSKLSARLKPRAARTSQVPTNRVEVSRIKFFGGDP